MMATLEAAGAWANPTAALPRAKAETRKLFVKRETPNCEDTTIIDVLQALESSADGEPEHRPLLEERIRLAVGEDGVRECRLIREHGPVRHDGGLQVLSHH